jgi:DNA sulfur modification protein DndC
VSNPPTATDGTLIPDGRTALTVRPRSAFDRTGYGKTVAALIRQVQDLYREDSVPWVVGYSGGKDSTATAVLVWLALAGLPPTERHKDVHVISTDTLVENPVIAGWVARSLHLMEKAAAEQGLPIRPHRLTPSLNDSFWVNLIGRGYASPRPKFRWCTERLKIKPSNKFIRDLVNASGEAILVLGTRKAESAVRDARMRELEKKRVRDLLSPNASLPNSLVYSPVEDWTTDDVWMFLMQNHANPWGIDHHDLLTIYQGASPDSECPLVIDSSTPSCGDSRFGCWTCTMVSHDKSMAAMISNDEEKEWMLPLLEFRDLLGNHDDRHLRDFRRKNGRIHLFRDRLVHGPYTQAARADWLRRLLEAQTAIQADGPDSTRDLELISLPELEEIRRIWVVDEHEFEDLLPGIYQDTTGRPYPGRPMNEHHPIGPGVLGILREITDGDPQQYELVRDLLDIEQQHKFQARRAGLFSELEQVLSRAYDDEEDALAVARRRNALLNPPADLPDPEQGAPADPPGLPAGQQALFDLPASPGTGAVYSARTQRQPVTGSRRPAASGSGAHRGTPGEPGRTAARPRPA